MPLPGPFAHKVLRVVDYRGRLRHKYSHYKDQKKLYNLITGASIGPTTGIVGTIAGCAAGAARPYDTAKSTGSDHKDK